MAKLTAAKVKALTKPGMHGDGLYLRVAYAGAKSWAFRATIHGKRRELGLGPYPAVPLARARIHAIELRLAVSNGRNPLAEKSIPTEVPTSVRPRNASTRSIARVDAARSTPTIGGRLLSAMLFPASANCPSTG